MERTTWLLCLVVTALPVGTHRGLSAQDAAPPPAAPTFEQRVAERAAAHRLAVSFAEGSFSGPGWELLLEEGRQSHAFLLGEEHGVAEIPALTRELFRALVPSGYRHLAVEISPPMAPVLDQLARGDAGLANLQRFFTAQPPGVAFFTLEQEAELLVAVRNMVEGPEPVVWGFDYEVAADRYLLDRVREAAPEGPARAAAEALYAKSLAAWNTLLETKNPAAFFTFSTPPEVFDELVAAWPTPDPESALAIEVLRETLAINQDMMSGRNWESNDRRARLNRGQLVRHLGEVANGPRVLYKFGASHLVRGRNVTEVFDLGNLVSEMATAAGSNSFHLLVVGGPGTQHAVFNPVELTYVPAPVDLVASTGLGVIVDQALPEGFTLFDLRPLRPLFSFVHNRTTHPDLMRIVHGFDALLVLTGSTPAKPLAIE